MNVYKNILNNHDWNEIRIIDETTGECKHYLQDKKVGFPFSYNETTVFEMGYKNVNEFIKTLKERKMLGSEIDYKEQRESERIGYINLGVERIKKHERINTNDFEDVIEKLKNYGMGFVDAQNVITDTYLWEVEQNEVIQRYV